MSSGDPISENKQQQNKIIYLSFRLLKLALNMNYKQDRTGRFTFVSCVHELNLKMVVMKVPLGKMREPGVYLMFNCSCARKAVSFNLDLNCKIMMRNACSKCIINTVAFFFLFFFFAQVFQWFYRKTIRHHDSWGGSHVIIVLLQLVYIIYRS